MSMPRAPKVALNSTFGLIVERLRHEVEGVTHEPLPTRWVELIRHLGEQERAAETDTQPADQDASKRRH